jgi:hypothetical protein
VRHDTFNSKTIMVFHPAFAGCRTIPAQAGLELGDAVEKPRQFRVFWLIKG